LCASSAIARVADRADGPVLFYGSKLQDFVALDPLTGYSRLLVAFAAAHPEFERVLLKEILGAAAGRGVGVTLPTDVVVATSPDAPGRTTDVASVKPDEAILDIGVRTQRRIGEVVAKARTVFWNGPAGVFEKPAFAAGTLAIARALAASSAFTVVGGGESVAAVQQAGVAAKLSHVSTGGGASLEFLAGDTLPGVAVLEERNK
jgi:phosphoglycerate kinase